MTVILTSGQMTILETPSTPVRVCMHLLRGRKSPRAVFVHLGGSGFAKKKFPIIFNRHVIRTWAFVFAKTTASEVNDDLCLLFIYHVVKTPHWPLPHTGRCLRKTCAPPAASPSLLTPRWSWMTWRSTATPPASKWVDLQHQPARTIFPLTLKPQQRHHYFFTICIFASFLLRQVFGDISAHGLLPE